MKHEAGHLFIEILIALMLSSIFLTASLNLILRSFNETSVSIQKIVAIHAMQNLLLEFSVYHDKKDRANIFVTWNKRDLSFIRFVQSRYVCSFQTCEVEVYSKRFHLKLKKSE